MALISFRFVAVSALFLLSTTVFARNISEIALSECGVDCYEASCNSTTDLACVCSDTDFNDIYLCLYPTCITNTDYYTNTRKLFYDCDAPRPVWTVDPDYVATAVTIFVIQSLFFGLRITSRVMGIGKRGWDDTTCVAAYVILVAQLVICVLEGYYRFYTNYWTLDFWKLPPFFKIDFARAELYAIGLGVCKMSILFLYQRIFEGPRLRWVLLGSQVFNALLILSYFISAFFVAHPLSCMFMFDYASNCTYNDAWDGSGAYSAVNAAFDIWLVAVPAVVVWRLQMKTERKINVIAVFATGVLTCLIALLRITAYRLQSNPNMTDYQYQLYMWVAYYAYYAELTSCFVIACLPAVRQLVGKKFWPVLRTGLGALSSTWSRTRSARSTRHLGSRATPTGASPLEASFPQHRAGRLRAEDDDQKDLSSVETVGYTL